MNTPNIVEFDLHGMVGLRLLDPTPGDETAVARQLGPIRAPLGREPDITLRFVPRLAEEPLQLLGVADAAFSEDAFYLLQSKHHAPARVRVPMAEVGGRCEILCQSGLPAVPLLIAIVNLTALAKGHLPLHAAAFTYQGRGVLVTGWSKGGKTEALLAFMEAGATYIGDEWVYLHADGETMAGIPEPIHVWDWHLAELPAYRALLPRATRLRLWGLRAAVGALERMSRGPTAGRSMERRLAALLQRQRFAHLSPGHLFPGAVGPMHGRYDQLFWVASHESSDLRVEPVTPEEIAERMVFSLLDERMDLLEAYWKFRFAFPAAHNPHIEQMEARQRERLQQLLVGRPAYAIFHPYPARIPAMFAAMEPLVRA